LTRWVNRPRLADGQLDVVVNSAGIVGPNNRRVTETPTDGFEQVLRVNLFGSLRLCCASCRVRVLLESDACVTVQRARLPGGGRTPD